MKRIIALFLIFALSFSMAACSNAPSTEEESSNPPQVSVLPEETEPSSTPESNAAEDTEPENTVPSETSEQAANILIAYFSWADNAVLADDVDAVASPSVIAPGNVQQLAQWGQERTGGDLFSIQVTDPYPSDWDECLTRANQERGNNARPELVENVENLENYDVVFLGYPNWWYGVPMALLTFLDNNDLSGKQVYLFCSHGTGGLANSVEIIKEALPDGEISDNIFDCYEEEAPDARGEIESWLSELGY